MRTRTVILFIIVAAVVVIGTALATPSSPLTVETARGQFEGDLKLKEKFANGGKVNLRLKGPVEVISQRIEVDPGETFGWHSHPGENFNVILQGTLTLYHDEHCTRGIDYTVGQAFTSSPDQIHLARNNSATVKLIFFATYFAPRTMAGQPFPVPVRLDQPSPGAGCTQ